MHLQCIDNLVARLVDNPASSRMEPGITESVSGSRRVTRTRKLINNPFPYQVETRSQNLSAKESCLETRSQNLSAKASCPLSLTVTVLILHYKIASTCGCKRCQLKLSTGGQNAKNY